MQEVLLQTQADLDALKENLASEKMSRVQAEADLDAAKNKKPDTTVENALRKELFGLRNELEELKNKKPDTSEIDALRADYQTLKNEHQASLMTAQQESAKATEEHLATKTALEKALKDFDAHQAAADEQSKTSQSDYRVSTLCVRFDKLTLTDV